MLASTSYQSILQEESQTIDLLSIQRDKYEKCKKNWWIRTLTTPCSRMNPDLSPDPVRMQMDPNGMFGSPSSNKLVSIKIENLEANMRVFLHKYAACILMHTSPYA